MSDPQLQQFSGIFEIPEAVVAGLFPEIVQPEQERPLPQLPERFIFFNNDTEIVAHTDDITIVSMEDDEFFDKGDNSWYGVETEVCDADDIEQLDVMIFNNRILLALLDRPGVTGDYAEEYVEDAKRNLAEAPARRQEILDEMEKEEKEEREAEARNQCSGTAMNGGILHAHGTHCPRHGSF